jgi:ATP-dependent DNA helicase RecG
VGRGADQASCVLMYQPPLGLLAKNRLGILRDTNDGFKIAQKDLEQRGPGEVLGTRQTGLQQLRIADLTRDKPLFPKIEQIARKLLTEDPQLVQPLIDRWIVNREQYAHV